MNRPTVVMLLTIVSFIALLYGCSDGPFAGQQADGQLPTVWLAGGPPEGSVNKYFLRMFWGGWDPDGEISHYQYIITDNPPEGIVINDALFQIFEDSMLWYGDEAEDENGNPIIVEKVIEWKGIRLKGAPIYSNDSTFTFSADVKNNPNNKNWIAEFRRSHTFFIRAVDDDGLVTPNDKVAFRSFTSRTLSPTVDIIIPSKTRPGNPAMVPPITTFKWAARDYIDDLNSYQDPESTRYILLPFINDNFDETVDSIAAYPDTMWSPWQFYDSNDDSTRFVVSPSLDIGVNYVFAVQAKDEAGAITPIFDENHNVRRILTSRRTTGPALSVFNKFIGNVAGASVSTPIVIFDLPEGIPLSFRWEATAEHYGGLVSGYRYGWNIVNLNEDDEWEVDFTPFLSSRASSPPRTFYFGTHTFHVEVVDNSGFKSRVGIRINIIPFTMERDLLMVDDFPDGRGIHVTKGAIPSDVEHDDFWLMMLSNVANFDPSVDFIEVDRGTDTRSLIVLMARYKSIVWDVYGWHSFSEINTPTLLYQLVRFLRPDQTGGAGEGKIVPNLLALYLEAGGHVLICGFQPLCMAINRSYFRGGLRFPYISLYEATGNQSGNYSRDGEIGIDSFMYKDCCVDVVDIAYTTSAYRRRGEDYCGLDRRNKYDDGVRRIEPEEGTSFPPLEFNPIVTLGGYFFEKEGMNTEHYNPNYFGGCSAVTYRREGYRDCFEVMLRQRTGNPSSVVDGAPVGIWSSTHADKIPPVGMPARSVVWGFEPYYFEALSVKQLIEHIVFEEWKLTNLSN